jgi:Protein of unknown function (DUF2795)
MEDILVLLERVDFPATRQDLIDAAAKRDLPLAMVARLHPLESRRYEDADDVADDLFGCRAESNPSDVAITAEACERWGFPRTAGEWHSCIEEKALFAESVNAATGTFERFDESTARQAVSNDLRTGTDRRQGDTQVGRTEERRHPVRGVGERAGAVADNGGQRRGPREDAD